MTNTLKRFRARTRWWMAAGAVAVSLALGAGGCGRAGLPPAPGTADWDRLSIMLTVFGELEHGIPASEYYGAPPSPDTSGRNPDK